MNRFNMILQLKMSLMIVSLTVIPGCLTPEDKGAVETVGNSVGTPPDFVVTPPPDNSGGSVPEELPENTLPSPGGEFGFSIANGAQYIHTGSVSMSFLSLPWFQEMKISSNATCQDGTWEPIVDIKEVTNFNRNAVNNYSVRFRDVDNVQSPCLSESFIHDDAGPDILVTKYPMASLEEGATAELIFEVKDVSPLADVTCKLNEIVKPCLKGTNVVSLSQMPAGSYIFTVTASDVHGYESAQSVSWNVVSTVRSLSQSLLVRDERKVDILIVIDNSGSMEYEQKNMADRVKNILSILRGLDYRIGVTTTDPGKTATYNNVKYYGDGDLIPIANLGAQLWIDSTMDEQAAQYNLGQTLQRRETGSGYEQGIRSTYRFVEKSASNGFFRDGANFATILISDEDESDNTEKNDPEKLLQLIASTFNSQKRFSYHSIITRPGDTDCKNTNGYSYGERYKKMTELTGGVLGSVCEADYATQVSGIANEIRDLMKNITLVCEPLTQFPIIVKKDGVVYSAPYTVSGVNMKFSEILEPGSYQVEYKCLKQ